MIKYKILFIIYIIFTSNAYAFVKEIEIPIMSYHINKSYNEAPSKIDSNAFFVLNPGILIGFDSRIDKKSSGLSFLGKAGLLKDCDNKNVYILSVGSRYRYFLSSRYSIDGNFYLLGANAVRSFNKKQNLCVADAFGNQSCHVFGDSGRKSVILSLPNIGFNYHYRDNNIIGFTLTYVPKNNKIGATSISDLIFLTLTKQF